MLESGVKDEVRQSLVSYRGFHPDDENFIMSTCLKSLWHGNDWFQQIDWEIFYPAYKRVIQHLMAKPEVVMKIACLQEDPFVILGFCMYERKIVHGIFCKTAWRGINLSVDLLPQNFEFVTHLTVPLKSFLKNKYPKVKFNPFLI